MGELELLLADLESRVGGGTALILVAPTPPKNLPGEGESLVPCLLLEAPAYPGLLTGNGTRRLGLLTNTDLAPVLISYLAGDVNQIGTGPDLTISSHPDPLNYLDQFYNRSNLVYRQRPSTEGIYPGANRMAATILGALPKDTGVAGSMGVLN